MAQIVKLRRSSVPGQKPTNSNLQLGELALNTTDGKVYMAKSGSLGPSVEELISTNTVNTGSIFITGNVTASNFSGSFKGDGSQLYNIPSSGVTGLELNKIVDGSATASISQTDGLRINTKTEITGSVIIDGLLTLNRIAPLSGSNVRVESSNLVVPNGGIFSSFNIQASGSVSASTFSGSAVGLINVPFQISGSDLGGNTYNKQFTKLQFDDSTGLNVSESVPGTAFISIGSHFKDIFVSGSPILSATGSDAFEVIGAGGLGISTSITDTNGNGYIKELTISATSLSSSLNNRMDTITGSITTLSSSLDSRINTINAFTSSVVLTSQTSSMNVLSASYALTAAFALNAGGGNGSITDGAYAVLNQTTPATTWTFKHSLGQRYPIFQVFDSNGVVILPSQITTIDVNNATITFPSNQTGKVIASLGTGPGGLSQYFSSNATWSLAHNLGSDYPIVTIWDTNRNIIFPQRIESVDTNNIKVYFSTPIAGYVNVAKGGHIISGSVVAGSIDYVGSNIVSSSVQILITGTTGYSTFSGSISSSIGSLSSSVATTTLGLSSSILSLSSSVALTTSGLTSTITTLSSSLSGSIDSLSSSVASINNTQNGRLDSLETASGSIRNNFNTFTSSYNTGSFTGSFKGDGTNLYNIPASGVTGLELYKIVSGSVSASISPNNGFRVNTDVYIDGTLTAKEIHTDYVTSSVLYQSGSTKFGDTSDDNHLFTGSVLVNGNISATSITGSINFNNLTNVPTLVSGSSQIIYSGLTGIPSGIVSGSSQISYTGITNIPSGIVSGSEQLTGSYDTRYVLSGSITQTTWNNIASKPNDIVSSSNQISAFGYLETGSFNTYTSSNNGRVSSLESFTASLNTNYVSETEFGTYTGSINTFTSSVNSYTSSNDGRVSSLESKTGSYATTGSNLFKGNQTISGSIIPAVDNTYDLGSLTNQFRDLYLSSASLYIDGTKVLGSTAQELQITTDTGQSFKILEASSDTITLQSADGNITLATSGGGDVIMDPTTGVIALKGTTTLYAGNKIVSSDGNSVQFGNGIAITGSVVSTVTPLVSGSSQINYSGLTGIPSGIISGSSQIDITGTTGYSTFSSSVSTSIGALSSSIATTTLGTKNRVDSIETSTGSLNTFTSSINTTIKSKLDSESVISGSVQVNITGTTGYSTFSSSISTSIGELSSSVATTTSGLSSSIGSLSSSIATTTLNTKNRVDSIETSTGSLNTFTSSASGRLTSLETASGSIRTDFNTYTGSNNTTNTTQDGRLTSIEGITGSISSLNTYTGSNNTVIGTLQTSTSSLNSYTSSNTTNIDAIHTSTGSFKSFTSSFDTAFGMSGADVTVKGNLTVSGTQTTVNSTTVAIGDNIIQLNGTGATNAGLVVRDATAPNTVSGSFLWDSTNDKWIAGALGSEDDVVLKTATQTLTNKTINASQLVDASVTNAKLQYSSLSIAGTSVSLNGSISAATILSGTGTVSGSSQISHDSTTGYVANRHIDHTAVSISAGNGLSGGGDISTTRTISLDTTSATFTTGVKSKMNADGVISGSAQISFNGITDKPTLVSGSSQITYGSLSGIPTGIVSGSSQITFGSISSIPSGLVSGSSQIDLTATTNYASGILTRLNAVGVFSGSAQVTGIGNAQLTNSSFNIGTTSISLGRASASQTLTGVSIDGNAATVTNFSGTHSGTSSGTNTGDVTETLATVTGRGNTTTTSMAIGSNSIPNGKLYVNSGSGSDVVALQNTLNTGAYLVFADTVTPTWANAPRLGAINNDMVFKILDVERFRMASTGATFTTTISASNLSGTNTGDQTLSGLGGLSNNTDSEQTVGGKAYYFNSGAGRMNADPRWNESGYDADLGCLHLWSWTAAGVAYGRAGIAFYNDNAYQYLTTKSNTTGLFVNNSLIATAGSSPTFASVTGTITSSGSGDSNAPFKFSADYSGWMSHVAGTPGSNNGWGLFWAGNSGAQYGTNGTGGPGDIWSNSGNPNEYVFVGNGQTIMSVYGNTGNVWIGGQLRVKGDLLPNANNSYDLGSSSLGWRNVYTNDLHLSNMGKPEGNDIDGTNGNWTIQEGAEQLYIINNNNGKKFKIDLTEII